MDGDGVVVVVVDGVAGDDIVVALFVEPTLAAAAVVDFAVVVGDNGAGVAAGVVVFSAVVGVTCVWQLLVLGPRGPHSKWHSWAGP